MNVRPAVIDVRQVTKRYRQGRSVVDAVSDVTFSIASGEFVVIAGPSGSGKSTLLHLAGALDKPDAGQVLVAGEDLSRLPERKLAAIRRHGLGFVFQAYNLVPVLSAYENVEYGLWLSGMPKKVRRAIVEDALSAVGLDNRAHHRPNQLSGGERQRVAIARALAHHPAAIIGDELTASLDPSTGGRIMDLLLGLNASRGMTFVLATHDMSIIERAPRVIQLHGGRVTRDSRMTA